MRNRWTPGWIADHVCVCHDDGLSPEHRDEIAAANEETGADASVVSFAYDADRARGRQPLEPPLVGLDTIVAKDLLQLSVRRL